ncbi:MAG: glycoside hydrolase family 2 protein, partial [Lachnospiraceae bacterium]|nr:glycoside hydrolase family 2 protein [Lachnospiraceae bacterium]
MKKIAWNEDWIFRKQDGEQRKVILPHDAMIEEERDPDAPSGSAGAFFPGGFYTYEKRFTAKAGEHLEFYFEGVYRNAKVLINGKEAGGAAYGYIPFAVCADDYVVEGENVLTVTVDNTQCPNSRWYSGSGIYRSVWMYRGGKEH